MAVAGLNMAAGLAGHFTGFHLDVFKAYNFLLEIHGVFVGGFKSVEGTGSKTEVFRFHEGGANGVEYKLPGPITYGDLVLSSGLTFVDPMWLWYRSTLYGKPQRRNGTIYLLDDVGVPAAWWNLTNAWPTEWIGPRFDATEPLVAIQSFTLVYESIAKSLASSAVGGAASLLEKLV